MLPWLLLAVMVPASIWLFSVIRGAVESVARLRFERQASDIRHVIDARVRAYAEILYGLQALLGTGANVTRRDFHRYVVSLDLERRYPGYDVVNYAAYVHAGDKTLFENSVRGDTSLVPAGYPSFRIKPPGERAQYFVIVYVEPMKGFEFAFGLDLGANTAVSGADTRTLTELQYQARDSGGLTASGRPIVVKGRGGDYIGLAVRLAVYRADMPVDTVEARRAAYMGSVGAGINVGELMKDVLGAAAANYIHFCVYDAGSSGAAATADRSEKNWFLYDSSGVPHESDACAANAGAEARFKSMLPLAFAGRTWQVHFSARKIDAIDRLDAFLPWMILIGGIVSSMLLAGIFYSLSSSRRRAMRIADEITKDLRASEAELRASTERLQAMSRRLVDLQESERRQFSRELHDRVGQNLTALSIGVDILRTELAAGGNPAVLARLADAAGLLESTHETIENVMTELRPPMLDDYGLLPAIQWYAGEFRRRTDVLVSVSGDEGMQRLSQAIEIALFRIIQEAFTNIAKHAHASEIFVSLKRSATATVLVILDNGVGLSATNNPGAERRTGLGMVTMRERAQAIGGEFEIGPGPAGGTEIVVRIAG